MFVHSDHPMPLYALTIFAGAFLLFLVQPLIAKQILPWFGGSAAVWSTCLAFFQVVLLAGYAYSDWTARRLSPRAQALLHVGLLLLSLALLPIVTHPGWQPTGGEDPGLRILGLLLATVGLPYFLLSTTGPLLQAWFARAYPTVAVYRLYALSNAASLIALISYPFVIEPRVATTWQAYGWSAGYTLFVLLCASVALYGPRGGARMGNGGTIVGTSPHRSRSDWRDYLLWLALPAMGSWLLLAITNHITQNIASMPFLWLLPLTLYLLTFIICFEHERWYRRWICLPLAAALLGAAAYGLQSDTFTFDLRIAIPLYLGALFAACMFCHGELAATKPPPRELTTYYLLVSLGGALGGLLVGLVAPRVLDAYYELGIGLTLTAVLAAVVLRRATVILPAAAAALALLCGYYAYEQITKHRANTRVLTRNFYGALQIKDVGAADHPERMRRLTHGAIKHGEQYLAPARRAEPTSYYGIHSGAGIALRLAAAPKRVGVIGLGAGTLAAYGQPGDVFRFYEINPQVIDIAQREFSFLKDSKARIEIALGDARLSLEREPPQQFDVLVIDAFSSDSIPVHLITREALAVYLKHLKPFGVIAFHTSNRYLVIPPVVKQLADHYKLRSAWISDDIRTNGLNFSDWVLVTEGRRLLDNPEIAGRQSKIEELPGLQLWTDNYNNLFRILR